MVDTIYSVVYALVVYALNLLGPIVPIAPSLGPGLAVWLSYLVVGAIIFAFSLVNVLVFIWWERKLLGRFMDRRGAMHVGYAGLLQNLADGLKLFRKQPFAPKDADELGYYFGPTAYLVMSVMILGLIPLSFGVSGGVVPLSLLVALALFSFAPLFIFIASWSSNNKYSLIGGMRTAAQLVAYEIPLLLAVVGVVALTGSFDLNVIVGDQARYGWFGLPLFLGLLLFFVAMLAEVERIPFDLPEAEAELVEGWSTEFGGMLFAFTMMGDYVRALIGSYLIVLLFLGGWSMPWGLSNFPLSGLVFFQVKTYVVFAIFIWVRASLPRVRTDQLLQIGWKRMLPLAMLNIVWALALVVWGWPTIHWPVL
ncbi:MAG: NADH-quinone oxidoreductase subunit NuoH [Candidatus Thermoplasmatota archaeon]|jgi:NADH-quinone oxidoreductase subunit H|nr:NADH-quinone oxidoreductase subunit NuoH [Candidatus Thermoplasmatota archaeon]